MLAIDELPILANRLLRGDTNRITPEGRRVAEAFLSWLRRNGQAHRGRISMILSGSIGLEPLLQQAGLSAHANIFSAYDLKPWSEESAPSVDDVLHVLRHDGYLNRLDGGYEFVSGYLEDWWRSRYGQHFVSVLEPETHVRRNAQ